MDADIAVCGCDQWILLRDNISSPLMKDKTFVSNRSDCDLRAVFHRSPFRLLKHASTGSARYID